MAPGFFSKLARATISGSTTSNEDSTTATTTTTTPNATTDTKNEKRRSSASRDRASGTTKSTKSTNDTPSDTHTPRSSFQFGISTLTRAASRNRAVSSPSAANGKNSAHNSTTNLHRKVESAGAPPPVPPVPDSLKAAPPAGTTRSRRNSIISGVFGGGKAQDNSSIVPQEPSADTSAIQGPPSIQLNEGKVADDDDDIPRIFTIASASRESVNSSELGVTVIPPSPLVYTASLASTHSSSVHDFPAAVEQAPANQGPEDNSTGKEFNQEVTSQAATPTQEQPTTATTASVLVSIFGRRARTASISSAISGIIGVGAPAKDKPAPVDVTNVEQDLKGSSPVTPSTATTIKAHPLPVKETPPPLPVTKAGGNMAPSTTLSPGHEVQRKASSRSLTNLPPPIIVPDHGATLSAGNSSKPGTHHSRAATTPAEGVHDNAAPTVTMTPIVESPTALKSEFLVSPSSSSSGKDQRNRAASTSAQSNGGGFTGMLSPKKGGDDDTASIISTTSKSPEKKRLFKRSTTRKPTGLASAIAATGLAMANPSISAMHSAQMNAAAASQTDTKSPYLSKSPTASVLSTGQRSATSVVSPRSGKSTGRKVSGGSTGKSPSASSFALHSAGSKKGRRRPSMSAHSDAASTGGLSAGGAPSEYYSGNESEGVRRRRPTRSASRVGGHSGDESDTEDEEDSSEEDSSDDDDVLDDLDLEDDDIPVTGFAVASNKRNADFHELFPNVPEGDYLIEDYGCALQREILIQGRLYISENHICFHANIFGWITDLSIPIDEITSLEKKTTAFVIPNAIQITTRQSRYSFASFLSRDTTYDVIYNIWRLARPDDVRSLRSGQGSLGGGDASGSFIGVGGPGPNVNGADSRANVQPGGVKKAQRKATQCACGKEGRHFTEVAMEATFPGSPEMIHNLMFASGFIKEFFTVDQKLMDIQMADWMPVKEGSNLLTRTMSYIKPLNAPMGPKQTKCEIKDEMEHQDFDDYITTVTSTKTPDVPSGGVFSVKTRTCIMWAGPISSKVVVSTQVEWTGRSFIKGIIERSAIDGQKVYHGDLEKAMRAYIQEHHSEFVPEGMDAAELEAAEEEAKEEDPTASGPAPTSAEGNGANISQEEREKRRERERNQRAWQWLLDTFEGAFDVAKQSTKTALDLLRDAWDQSSSTTILYFVIIILVVSNLYTLIRMGKKEEVGRRKEMMKQEERERWVQSVVSTLWEELAAGKQEAIGFREKYPAHPPLSFSTILPSSSTPDALETPLPPVESLVATPGSWKEEVAHLHQTLALVEERIKSIKHSLAAFEKLDQLD